MIKLKTLILEGRRPTISKQEEEYALQVIRSKLFPSIVEVYNNLAKGKWGVPEVTLDEVRKQLKKVRVENFTNGQEIRYAVKLPGTTLEFKTQKLNHGRKALENEDIIVFEVGWYDFGSEGWGDLGWNIYTVEYLANGYYGPDPLKYSV